MLYLIPTPIGNLSDISFHALGVLKSVPTIICEDTRVTKSLLHLLEEKYDFHFDKKTFLSLHSHNEANFFKNIDPKLFETDLAYLSDAGMPGLSDPGLALVKYAQKTSMDYEVLSGANAALLALVASGLCEKEFTFLGFLPKKANLDKILQNPYPSVIYESPLRVLQLIKDFALQDPSRQIFCIKEASKKFEKKFWGKASEVVAKLEEANLKGEWTVVVAGGKVEYENSTLNRKDLEALPIKPRLKAKLIAKLTGMNPKALYEELLD